MCEIKTPNERLCFRSLVNTPGRELVNLCQQALKLFWRITMTLYVVVSFNLPPICVVVQRNCVC